MICWYCGKDRFRRSHFQLKDILWLLVLRYPVRCSFCHKRAYTNIFRAQAIRRAQLERRRKREQKKDEADR
jgi:hypothetical protein